MSQPLLVLDCHYICHRAFHSTRELAHGGKITGVVFGFLKAISFFKDQFQTDRVAFCFEHPKLYRREVYPDYKNKRKARTDEERASYQELAIQISELRQRYLPTIGFKNIFRYRGMESDDIMAAIAANAGEMDEVILITADSDLYQCIRENVRIYSPRAHLLLNQIWFEREYGITPRQWARVKAIAGCSGDGVPGIKGVGEITALKYLRGELPEKHLAYRSIQEGSDIIKRNRSLVKLPFKGCPVPEMQDDKISKKGWLEVCDQLGMRSLAQHPPVAIRKMTA
jgi:5'-3' exonuclease